jgi:hypothetical protein
MIKYFSMRLAGAAGNLITESNIIVGRIFPAFLCMALLAKLAYVQTPGVS